jgi:trk system potassium uptake protein TrkH
MLALAATGLDFERALILSVAALTTTGPLAQVAGEAPISYAALTDPAKVVLAVAMILGRVETLVLIALFNRAFWRS